MIAHWDVGVQGSGLGVLDLGSESRFQAFWGTGFRAQGFKA